ncbi:hydantoinase/oxoprolinase N-terminal domain-containing protein [Reyranella sp.]|uniref:hydantoinase/oxoprolinase N-terminal domain-containing protein n=1 Tax=Reyranella sp. TaxID=1929291 RepID=UPI0037847F9A
MKRIGIDVGGTNTDAALIVDGKVVKGVKTPTTEDVMTGVRKALELVFADDPAAAASLDGVMIGTTHFVNAVVQRRGLNTVAAVRIGLPSGASLTPFIDWPRDLRGLVSGAVHMVRGGHEVDGRPLVPLDRDALREAAARIGEAGITSVGITAVFSPLTAECELEAAEILRRENPDLRITLSSALGRIGLLERENVTLLNACLQDLAVKTTKAFVDALRDSGIRAPLYLTQNDGTIMRAEVVEAFPVYCFASGPTNSMRGAAFLSGLEDGVVVDVGGTTTDIGYLKAGFPREANNTVEVGGVRTLFRMPDLLSIGLGGGTEIAADSLKVGPGSVGYRLPREALVFGGRQLTATDIAVAAGIAEIGDRGKVAHLDRTMVAQALRKMQDMIAEGMDRMKTEAGDLPLLAVGGGSFLIPDRIEGASEVVRVEHHAIANAVGAGIAQVSGEIDRIFTGMGRDKALETASEEARAKAVASGADARTLKTVETEDLPLSYLPGDTLRVRVRVVGDIAAVS